MTAKVFCCKRYLLKSRRGRVLWSEVTLRFSKWYRCERQWPCRRNKSDSYSDLQNYYHSDILISDRDFQVLCWNVSPSMFLWPDRGKQRNLPAILSHMTLLTVERTMWGIRGKFTKTSLVANRLNVFDATRDSICYWREKSSACNWCN